MTRSEHSKWAQTIQLRADTRRSRYGPGGTACGLPQHISLASCSTSSCAASLPSWAPLRRSPLSSSSAGRRQSTRWSPLRTGKDGRCKSGMRSRKQPVREGTRMQTGTERGMKKEWDDWEKWLLWERNREEGSPRQQDRENDQCKTEPGEAAAVREREAAGSAKGPFSERVREMGALLKSVINRV